MRSDSAVIERETEVTEAPFGLDGGVPEEVWILLNVPKRLMIGCEWWIASWASEEEAIAARTARLHQEMPSGKILTPEFQPMATSESALRQKARAYDDRWHGIILLDGNWGMIARRWWK